MASDQLQSVDGLPKTSRASGLLEGLLRHYPNVNFRKLNELAIIGAGSEGERLATLCHEHGIKLVALADDNPLKRGKEIAGQIVAPVSELLGLRRTTPVVVASHRVLNATRRVRELGFETVIHLGCCKLLHRTFSGRICSMMDYWTTSRQITIDTGT